MIVLMHALELTEVGAMWVAEDIEGRCHVCIQLTTLVNLGHDAPVLVVLRNVCPGFGSTAIDEFLGRLRLSNRPSTLCDVARLCHSELEVVGRCPSTGARTYQETSHT